MWQRAIRMCMSNAGCPTAVPAGAGTRLILKKEAWHAICEAVPMTPEQIDVVQRTWRAVLPVGDTAAELFYGKLFSVDPQIQKLFRNDMLEQGRNLTAMISVAVGALSRP